MGVTHILAMLTVFSATQYSSIVVRRMTMIISEEILYFPKGFTFTSRLYHFYDDFIVLAFKFESEL